MEHADESLMQLMELKNGDVFADLHQNCGLGATFEVCHVFYLIGILITTIPKTIFSAPGIKGTISLAQ